MHKRFDQFAKQMAQACFAPAGVVRTEEEVSPDAQRIDIWFTPHGPEAVQALAPLGLLGRMGSAACTMEPFHDTPGGADVMDCVCKHHSFRVRLGRSEPETPLPVQWIVSSGRPETALAGLRFEPAAGWGAGVYEGPSLTNTRVVAVAELPETRDTLLVRLMGAGRVLQRAIAELRALPDDAPERTLALPILLRLRFEIPDDPTKRTEDDEEFFMTTQDAFEAYLQKQRDEARDEGRDEGMREGRDEGMREGRDEGMREGRDEGMLEGLRIGLLALYADRFGAPPADLAAVLARIRDRERLLDWQKLVVRAPADEVLAAVRNGSR